MKEETLGTRPASREGERGAVLITVLLLSTMLLLAGGALLMTTTMTTANAFDATTELQSYYAAEAGLQEAMRVLRGNSAPAPLFAGNPAGGVAAANKLSFRRAVTRANSNLNADPAQRPDGTPFPLRLSRWLPYNFTPPGSAFADRVALSPNYNPANGMAYSVELIDPAYPTPPAIAAQLAAAPDYSPPRLIIRSTGYGPRGARKELSVLVSDSFFDIDPPAPIVIRGSDDGSPMTFDLGSSGAKKYSGRDNAGKAGIKPAVAIKTHDWNEAVVGNKKGATVDDPELGILDIDPRPMPPYPTLVPPPLPGQEPGYLKTPEFLKTADAARAFMANAREVAKVNGQHFTTSKTNFVLGSAAQPGFAFIDGNCQLDGGAGLLFVTGELVLRGDTSFEGVIVTLGAGRVTRSGGGGGKILGAWYVAKFNATGGFLAPYFDVSGGGSSEFLFDTNAKDKANKIAGLQVLGVLERTSNAAP